MARKQPKVKELPVSQKKPRTAPEASYNNHFLSWHIGMVEMVDPFGWHTLTPEKLIQVRSKLAEFENRTWNEVLVIDKDHNHSVLVAKLCKDAQDRLIEIGQDDVDALVSLRLSSRERVWGIRHQHALKILWWDPEHDVCPSLKKHT